MNIITAITRASAALEQVLRYGEHYQDCRLESRDSRACLCDCGLFAARRDARLANAKIIESTSTPEKDVQLTNLYLSTTREALRELLEATEPEQIRERRVRAAAVLENVEKEAGELSPADVGRQLDKYPDQQEAHETQEPT